MTWDEQIWNRYLRNERSALVKRDALLGGVAAGGAGPGPTPEDRREYRAWAAKAEANLRRLALLAAHAPDRRRAEETVDELRKWFGDPIA